MPARPSESAPSGIVACLRTPGSKSDVGPPEPLGERAGDAADLARAAPRRAGDRRPRRGRRARRCGRRASARARRRRRRGRRRSPSASALGELVLPVADDRRSARARHRSRSELCRHEGAVQVACGRRGRDSLPVTTMNARGTRDHTAGADAPRRHDQRLHAADGQRTGATVEDRDEVLRAVERDPELPPGEELLLSLVERSLKEDRPGRRAADGPASQHGPRCAFTSSRAVVGTGRPRRRLRLRASSSSRGRAVSLLLRLAARPRDDHERRDGRDAEQGQ